MISDYFQKLNYAQYLKENPINKDLNEEIEDYNSLNKKKIYSPFFSVDPTWQSGEVLATEYDDLIRLHHLITSRKATTVMEFGAGKSTVVINNALEKNREKYFDFCKENLRRTNLFECYTVDNNEEWIKTTQEQYSFLSSVKFHYSKCIVSTFNDRICTYYEDLPNICPDFIYLDGPDQFSPEGNVRGISTNHPDRLPMTGDILSMEYFLLPGTLIVVDGRTANAMFLKNNLQRNWEYFHSEEWDQHFFELKEPPLGRYNKKQIDFCLGEGWFKE